MLQHGPLRKLFSEFDRVFFLAKELKDVSSQKLVKGCGRYILLIPSPFVNAPETTPNMLKQTLNHCFLWVLHIRGWEYSFAVASFFLQFLHNSERPKHAKTEVINPDTTYQIAWQILTSACMAFVAIVTPIQVLWIMWIGKIRE